MTVAYDDSSRVDIRDGTVHRAEPYPEARKPSLKPWGDFGAELGREEELRPAHPALRVGRQVAVVVNFAPRQIGKFMSEVLVLGFPNEEGEVVLIGPDRPVPDGGKLY